MSDTKPEKPKKIKKPKKPKKRDLELLYQVGGIFAVIFVIVIAIIAFIQVKGSTDTYLEAKQEFMKPLAEKLEAYYEYLGRPGVVFDQWLAEPLLSTGLSISSEGDEFYDELTKDFPLVNMDAEFQIPDYDPEEWENYTPRQRMLLASYLYQEIWMYQLISMFQTNNQQIYVLDVSREHWGSVYLDLKPEEVKAIMAASYAGDYSDFNYHLGEDYSDLLDGLKSINKVISTRKTIFERYDSPKDGKYYYLCIIPIQSDGVVRGVFILSHDWSEFHSSLISKLFFIVAISALLLIAASIVLLIFIYRAAIRPLRKVQKGVREYMVTKQSNPVVSKMEQIKQRNEFGVLADDVSHMVVEIDRHTAEITKLSGERERVATELSLASNIQAGVLPTDFPTRKDFELYASMTPAKEVGGDLYDFFDIDETHVGLVIGDVSGKGIPASLFMMISKLLIQEYGKTELSPARVLTNANKTLCANNTNDMFVTVWFGILDLETGKIKAASAGHEFPIMKNPDGDFEIVKDRHGFVLGAMELSRYKEYEIELKPGGGTLLVYTDGAAEATNAENELFGTDRMIEALNEHPGDHPKEVVDHLTEAINAFVGDAPQFDDLTMLCVRYNGQGA